MHFLSVIEPLLDAEGGMRIHEQEPGGASNHGISLVTFRKYHNNQALQITDLALLTREEAKPIYASLFWTPIDGDSIQSKMVAKLHFDQAANRGVEGFRELLVNCLKGRFNQVVDRTTPFAKLNELVNAIPEREFFRRLLCDAQHSYREIAFRKQLAGLWSEQVANDTLKIWMVRTHNLLKLLV